VELDGLPDMVMTDSDEEPEERDLGLTSWRTIGMSNPRFFPTSTKVINADCKEMINDLGDQADAYGHSDCSRDRVFNVFKTWYDGIKKAPDDFGLWREFFKRELPQFFIGNQAKYKVTTLDEAWQQVLNAKIQNKSCGYPFNTDAPCGNNHQTKLDVRNCTECWKLISDCFDCILAGKDPAQELGILCDVGDVFPKDELLKKKKIIEGRTRLIVGASMFVILVQLAVAPKAGTFKDEPFEGASRIGMTGPYGGFNRIRRKMQSCKHYRLSDYRRFDCTQHEEGLDVVMFVLKHIFGIDDSDGPTANAWNWVSKCLSGAKKYRVYDTIVEALLGGINSSGNRWTGEINTVYGVMSTIYSSFNSPPTAEQFYVWIATSGRYMNKYGDDTLDGVLTTFVSEDFALERLRKFGLELSKEDFKTLNTIVGMEFLGYRFTDCAYGVSFLRSSKAILQFAYRKFKDDEEKFLHLQCLKVIMAGNMEGLKILCDYEKRCDFKFVGSLNSQQLINFWTGRESFTDSRVMSLLPEMGENLQDGLQEYLVPFVPTVEGSNEKLLSQKTDEPLRDGKIRGGDTGSSRSNADDCSQVSWRPSGGNSFGLEPVDRRANSDGHGGPSTEPSNIDRKYGTVSHGTKLLDTNENSGRSTAKSSASQGTNTGNSTGGEARDALSNSRPTVVEGKRGESLAKPRLSDAERKAKRKEGRKRWKENKKKRQTTKREQTERKGLDSNVGV
jgi:hypothetical protein